jgi:hypothetical protein
MSVLHDAGGTPDRVLQRYLDGDLPNREATQLFLDAERDAELARELATYRQLFGLLDRMQREEPSAKLDAQVLRAVPYQRYASAPRRALPVLALGARMPGFLVRTLGLFRSGVLALVCAYSLFLLSSHSLLQRFVGQEAYALGTALNQWATRSAQVPVLSTFSSLLAGAYGSTIHAISSLGERWGGSLVTLVLGFGLAALILGAVGVKRHRFSTKRSHA